MPNAATRSARLYRWLLQLYPAHFRAEYGSEMATVFQDVCRAEYKRNGVWGLAGVWAEAAPDLIVSITAEHTQEDFQMTKIVLTRGLALAGLVGGGLWVVFGILANRLPAGVEGGDSRNMDSLVPLLGMAWLLLTLGLIGVYTRYSPHWSLVAKVALLGGVLGGLEVVICFLFKLGWPTFVIGWLGLGLCACISAVALFLRPTERIRAVLLAALGLSLFIINFENWLVLFGAVIGLCAIGLSALLLTRSLSNPTEPPVAPA